MKRLKLLTMIVATAAWLLGVASYAPAAQESVARAQEALAAQATPQTGPPLAAAELDQLTAPIALYSDPLLGMVLAASTYPPEVAAAARWLDTDDHASLHGDALDAALAQQGWDRSVNALVAVPQVLRMMSRNLEWTAQLGDAFLSQQADVMESIQRLRRRAAASGALQSGPQDTVSTDEGEVAIEPVSPDVIHVPCYTPAVYGPWPWPAYPPLYFPPPAGFCSAGPLITFGIGLRVIRPYWGWSRWNWRRRGFYVLEPRHTRRGRPRIRPWTHNPAHRRGARYSHRPDRRHLGPKARTWRSDRGLRLLPARPRRSKPPRRAAPRYTAPRTTPRRIAPQAHGRPAPSQAAPRPVPHRPRRIRPRRPASQSQGHRSRQRPPPTGGSYRRSATGSHGGSRRSGRGGRAHDRREHGHRPPR